MLLHFEKGVAGADNPDKSKSSSPTHWWNTNLKQFQEQDGDDVGSLRDSISDTSTSTGTNLSKRKLNDLYVTSEENFTNNNCTPIKKHRKLSFNNLSVERQKNELSILQFDSNDDTNTKIIKLDGFPFNEAEIHFSPSWDSTLINDSQKSDCNAFIRFNNKDYSFNLFSGSIMNQISLIKALQCRQAKIEKELQSLSEFDISNFSIYDNFEIILECKLSMYSYLFYY